MCILFVCYYFFCTDWIKLIMFISFLSIKPLSITMAWYENDALIKFETPCTISITAPSNTGKTHFVKKLLEHAEGTFTDKLSKIIYYHSAWQTIFGEIMKSISEITFIEGIPSHKGLQQVNKNRKPLCLVFDDLASHINLN